METPSSADDIRSLMLKIERTYRDQWRPSSTLMLAELVARIPAPLCDELLVRLIQTDMELGIINSRKPTLHLSSRDAALAAAMTSQEDDNEDDERVEPRIELYLLRFPQLRQKWKWLSQLIVFEFTLLSNGNDGRSLEYYCDLFPEYSSSIDELLRRIESNLQRHSSAILTYRGRANPSDKTAVAACEDTGTTWTLPRTLGRYYLLSFVDSGGMGNVFRALDMKRGTLVAIKVMRRDDTWSIYQFNQEFRTLAKIRHPNLVRMYDAFSETGLRYFSMELIAGCDIGRWAAENRHQRHFYSRLRLYLKQLISVIHHLHQHGVVHRDIKPSNVLLRSPQCAVLLDCSLAQRWDQPSVASKSEHDDVVGTLCYMAPEVLARQTTTPASDWYSLGVTLYELLTGEYPNPPTSEIYENLYAQEFEQRIEKLGPNIPGDLRQLCLSLLQKNPSARPSGAAIAQLMGTAASPPARVIKPLIGRGPIIASIMQALNAESNTAKPLILYGESGIGLTAILEQICDGFVETKNNLIIRVGSLKQDRTPHSIVTPLLHHLLDALKFRDRIHWYPILQKYAPSIAAHFQEVRLRDELRNIEIKNTASQTDSLTAVAELLTDLSQQQRLTIVVDDLQWCDPESIDFLVMDLPALPASNLRVLASCVCTIARVGHHDSLPNKSPVLQELEQKQHVHSIRIPPLGSVDMHRLLRELAPDSDHWSEQQRESIYRASNGNPGQLQHILRYLTNDSQRITGGASEYQFTYYRWHQTELSTLSKLARKMAQFLACAYQPLKLVTLERLLKASPDKLQEAQEELELGRWIVTSESNDGISVTLADSNLRPVILDALPPAALKRRNHRLAQCLITLHDSPWLLIGYHYQAAGSYSRAMDAFKEAHRTAKSATDMESSRFAIKHLENRNYHNS